MERARGERRRQERRDREREREMCVNVGERRMGWKISSIRVHREPPAEIRTEVYK